jgi:hypothetical protein
MRRSTLLVAALVGACATGEIEEALPREVEATQKPLTNESAGAMPGGPRIAQANEVAVMESEVRAQRAARHIHHDESGLDALLEQIVATPPGQARQRLLEDYATAAHGLGELGRKRAILRANVALAIDEKRGSR